MPPTTSRPRPITVTGTLAGGSGASSASFACRHACTNWPYWAASSRPVPSFASTARASARSMLSPPSSRCSPTAWRTKPISPRSSTASIRLKSLVPPPTSTTRLCIPGFSRSTSFGDAVASQA